MCYALAMAISFMYVPYTVSMHVLTMVYVYNMQDVKQIISEKMSYFWWLTTISYQICVQASLKPAEMCVKISAGAPVV